MQEDVGTYYSADATRPLSIVNTDNRLLASAARLAWEPLLAPLISDDQQGFLQGRSMIRNLVELDYFSMLSSLTSENGAAVLFDVRAAFPSVSQQFLLRTLRYFQLPELAISLISALYDENHCVYCVVAMQDGKHPGFPMSSGVRQGCPLSPPLFALIMDVFICHVYNH